MGMLKTENCRGHLQGGVGKKKTLMSVCHHSATQVQCLCQRASKRQCPTLGGVGWEGAWMMTRARLALPDTYKGEQPAPLPLLGEVGTRNVSDEVQAWGASKTESETGKLEPALYRHWPRYALHSSTLDTCVNKPSLRQSYVILFPEDNRKEVIDSQAWQIPTPSRRPGPLGTRRPPTWMYVCQSGTMIPENAWPFLDGRSVSIKIYNVVW